LLQIFVTGLQGPWSISDDKLLQEYVSKHGSKKWSKCSLRIPGRTNKQCIERYNYILNPEVNKSEWSPKENYIIFNKYIEYGGKLSKISSLLAGRTDITIKNRFYSTLRKYYNKLSQNENNNKQINMNSNFSNYNNFVESCLEIKTTRLQKLQDILKVLPTVYEFVKIEHERHQQLAEDSILSENNEIIKLSSKKFKKRINYRKKNRNNESVVKSTESISFSRNEYNLITNLLVNNNKINESNTSPENNNSIFDLESRHNEKCKNSSKKEKKKSINGDTGQSTSDISVKKQIHDMINLNTFPNFQKIDKRDNCYNNIFCDNRSINLQDTLNLGNDINHSICLNNNIDYSDILKNFIAIEPLFINAQKDHQINIDEYYEDMNNSLSIMITNLSKRYGR